MIVNDLTNRELIRRKFTFEEPSIHKYGPPPTDYNEDNDVFSGSTVFDEGIDI